VVSTPIARPETTFTPIGEKPIETWLSIGKSIPISKREPHAFVVEKKGESKTSQVWPGTIAKLNSTCGATLATISSAKPRV
jgi:hypothetical protein